MLNYLKNLDLKLIIEDFNGIFLYVYLATVSSDLCSETHNESKKCSYKKTPSHSKIYESRLLDNNVS